MGKLTSEQKEKLAYEILELLKENECNIDVRIYFVDKCLTGEGELIENVKASDYFDYANDDTLSMTFEGAFYEIINYYSPKWADVVMPKFDNLLHSYGLYYELGNYWNLAMYYSDSDLKDCKEEPIEGSSSKNPLYIRKGSCPDSLEDIRAEWEYWQNDYGDIGSCVLGAGFRFKYEGLYFKMPPQGHTQGSVSWEASKDDIEKKLKAAGCEEVSYDWGNMD